MKGATGKWGNDFARAPRLTPNRQTSIELSSRLAIRKRHDLCTPSLFPLSAPHGREGPAGENEKLPSKWEKRPVSVWKSPRKSKNGRENPWKEDFQVHKLGYFAEYKYICMPIIINVAHLQPHSRVNSRVSLAEKRWLVNRENDNLIEIGARSLVTTKLHQEEWTL
jgi:hypothetical protein